MQEVTIDSFGVVRIGNITYKPVTKGYGYTRDNVKVQGLQVLSEAAEAAIGNLEEMGVEPEDLLYIKMSVLSALYSIIKG